PPQRAAPDRRVAPERRQAVVAPPGQEDGTGQGARAPVSAFVRDVGDRTGRARARCSTAAGALIAGYGAALHLDLQRRAGLASPRRVLSCPLPPRWARLISTRDSCRQTYAGTTSAPAVYVISSRTCTSNAR